MTSKSLLKITQFLFLSSIVACGGGGGSSEPEPVPNSIPVANDDSATVVAGSSLTIDVLENDTDSDNDSLTVTNLTQPSLGMVSISNNQVLFEAADVAGEYQFNYSATDGKATSASATVTVTVTEPPPAAPIAFDDSSEVEFQGQVTIDVLANDTDANNDQLVITNLTQPTIGSASIVDNAILFEADDESGEVEFTYTANDGELESEPATIRLLIAANSAPESNNDEVRMGTLENILVDVLDNDSDANGHEMIVELVSQASQGTAEIVDNAIRYEAAEQFGQFVISYRVFDGFDYGNTAELTIEVDHTDLILKGRISPPVEGVEVVATTNNVEGVNEEYLAITDASGEYSVGIEVKNLEDFISLRTDSHSEQLSYLSNVGTASRLFGLATDLNALEYTNYTSLELSAYSTALYVYANWYDEDGFIESTAELETLYTAVDSIKVVKFAANLGQIVSGEQDFPNDITSFSQLYSDRIKVNSLSNSVRQYEFNQAFNSLVENTTFIEEDMSKIIGNSYAFLSNGGLLDTQRQPIIFELNENGDASFSSNHQLRPNAHYGYTPNLRINHDLFWDNTDSKKLRLYTTEERPIEFIRLNAPSNLCVENTNFYTDIATIEFYPVYAGETINQYLVHYKGKTHGGPTPNETCESTAIEDWSILQLVTTKISEPTFENQISSNLIAAHVGKIFGDNTNSVQASSSYIDLNNDNSINLHINEQSGEWSYSASGELILTLEDETEIRYIPVGSLGLGTQFIAKKTYPDETAEIFGGLLLNIDSSYVPESMVGRFEIAHGFGTDQSYAFAFQENLLGRQEKYGHSSVWEPNDSTGDGVSIFDWTPSVDGLSLYGVHSAIHNPETPFYATGVSPEGCEPDNELCFEWRTRTIYFLAEDEEYFYLLENWTSDLKIFYPDTTADTAYLTSTRLYKKTDFILPYIDRP